MFLLIKANENSVILYKLFISSPQRVVLQCVNFWKENFSHCWFIYLHMGCPNWSGQHICFVLMWPLYSPILYFTDEFRSWKTQYTHRLKCKNTTLNYSSRGSDNCRIWNAACKRRGNVLWNVVEEFRGGSCVSHLSKDSNGTWECVSLWIFHCMPPMLY